MLCHCRQRINFHRGACCVWKDALSSATSELGNQNSTTQEGGWSLASLTNLLSSGNQALSADNMNNAAGILQYCAKQKLASVTDAENIKNQVLEKLGLNSEEQKKTPTIWTAFRVC